MTKARDLASNSSGSKPTLIDAKADLIVGTGADAASRLAVGSNGDTIVADSAATTGLRWQGDYAAGKNKVINGDFFINQRGTTSTTTSGTFLVDRFRLLLTAAAGSVTGSVEQFTAGTAPVSGYEAKQYCRIVTTGQAQTTDRALLSYAGIEDVRSFAGQTVTISFWAKAASGTPNVAIEFAQSFGTGGSPSSAVTAIGSAKTAISTSWARYSFNVNVPSISGKTIGTDANTSALQFSIWVSAGSSFDARTATLGLQNNTFDIWGVQVEAGSVATAFQTATGTLQGELAACLYYFNRIADFSAGGSNGHHLIVTAQNFATTGGYGVLQYPKMRISPTATFSGNADFFATGAGGNNIATTAMAANQIKPNSAEIRYTTASGLVAGNAALLYTTTTTGKLDLSAEL